MPILSMNIINSVSGLLSLVVDQDHGSSQASEILRGAETRLQTVLGMERQLADEDRDNILALRPDFFDKFYGTTIRIEDKISTLRQEAKVWLYTTPKGLSDLHSSIEVLIEEIEALYLSLETTTIMARQ